jgi:hypothetical protein
MGEREQRRAAARAGKSCLVCGAAIDARRSTRRYCSDACRVKAHRQRGPSIKEGLLRGQIRILEVLGGLKGRGGLPRLDIAYKAKMSQGHMPDLIGQVDESRRTARQALTGIRSLLSRGWVESTELDVDGKKERVYTITLVGRAALQQLRQGRNDTAPSP